MSIVAKRNETEWARTQLALRLRFCVFRLLPALVKAMATACLTAFFFVCGWLVPIDPSFFQSSTSVLILLLTTDWLDPFLSGMVVLQCAESILWLFNPLRCCQWIEVSPVSITPFALCLFDIQRTLRAQGSDHAIFVFRICNVHRQYDATMTAF